MDNAQTGQLTRTAADIYEEFFVPALFADWAAPVCAAAGVSRGQRTLDVACGTGVLAREMKRLVDDDGEVVAIDRNDGMLAVAQRIAPGIDWRSGQAEALPFDDAAFDAVACQFGLMFFEDRVQTLREMRRVLRPGGRLAIAVWDALEHSPGYEAMVHLLDRLFGAEIASALKAPFVLGDRDELSSLFDEAGIDGFQIDTMTGAARFPSIDAWVRTDVKGWTLAELIDDAQFETLRQEAAKELARFVAADGSVRFAAPAHIVSATG